MLKIKLIITFLSLCTVTLILPTTIVDAQTTSAQEQQMQSLSQQIAELQQKLDSARSQERTLKSELDYIDNQTQLTNLKIQQATYEINLLNSEITDLDGRIGKLSVSLNQMTNVLLNRITKTYEYEYANSSPLDLLFSKAGFANALESIAYLQVAQAHDKQVLYQIQATKFAYHDQVQSKQTRQDQEKVLKQQLASYQTQLDQEKQTKQELLTETQGSEVTYEKLIAQAKAQLAGFQHFTQGRATILANQTYCDSWGCYYNQRDSQWGDIGLDGTNYSLADYGCLITSMAMVYTHYGHRNVTPLTINSNSDNFAAYAPTYLKYTINADGITATRAQSIIDNELSAGRPVIVGIGQGPDHFVVLISGSNGNYKMNDPFIANGHDINFTDYYSLNSISEVDKIIF